MGIKAFPDKKFSGLQEFSEEGDEGMNWIAEFMRFV